MLTRAHAHKGASLLEILQNCIIYHDGAFGPVSEKAHAADASVRLVHGEPMLFGMESELGLVFKADAGRFEVARPGADCTLEEIARHDETDLSRATALTTLGEAEGEPTALGVLYARPEDGQSGMAKLNSPVPMKRETLARLLSTSS